MDPLLFVDCYRLVALSWLLLVNYCQLVVCYRLVIVNELLWVSCCGLVTVSLWLSIDYRRLVHCCGLITMGWLLWVDYFILVLLKKPFVSKKRNFLPDYYPLLLNLTHAYPLLALRITMKCKYLKPKCR